MFFNVAFDAIHRNSERNKEATGGKASLSQKVTEIFRTCVYNVSSVEGYCGCATIQCSYYCTVIVLNGRNLQSLQYNSLRYCFWDSSFD